MTAVETRCNCGGVTLALSGDSVAQFYCHCDDCQAVHGAAFVPIALYRASDVKITSGASSVYQRKQTPRHSCPTCGTRLFADLPAFGLRSVVAQLLPAGTFNPTFHMQCQHARVPLKDDLPHFKGFPPLFGGSDDEVVW